MELNEYQAQALRTAGPKCRGDKAYSMGGVGGEAGEYVDVVKKFLWHETPEQTARQNALKELGDLMWGLAQAADAWGLSLSEIAEANIAKLRLRYPDGFTVQASAARVDVTPGVEKFVLPLPTPRPQTYSFDANGSPVPPGHDRESCPVCKGEAP